MNVTTWSRECHADLGLAIPGPAERSTRAETIPDMARRRGKSMLPGIALSAMIHAGVLAVVLFAVANPFSVSPRQATKGSSGSPW